MMASPDGLDLLLIELGVGRWNYLFYITSLLVPATIPGLLIVGEFINPLAIFTCNLPDNNYTTSYNGSQCFMVEEEKVVPCTNWTYDTSVFQSTVSMEWDLVCGRAALAPLFQTIFTGGSFLGSILAAIAAHRYGRRWAVRVGVVVTTAGVVLLTVCPWFSLALVIRFLLGVFNSIMVFPAFLLSMEVCVPRLRPTVGMMLAVPYAFMIAVLAGLAYCIREWRPLQAASSLPCLLLLLPSVYLVDESPRWLVVRGKLEEAVKVLQRASRLNGVDLPEPSKLTAIVSAIHKKQNMTGKQMKKLEVSVVYVKDEEATSKLGADDGIGSWWAGPVALVRTPCVRRMMAVLVLMWLMMGVIYLGLPLSSDAFSSPFLYMALLGLVEVPAYTLTAPITQRLGRRSVICFCFITCGLLLFFLFALILAHIHNEIIDLVLVMVAYLLICTAFQVNFLYASELLPTSIRPWGTAVCNLSSCVGFNVSPFVTDYLVQELPWLPTALFGSCGLLSGVLVLFLPETNGLMLPETVADLQQQRSTSKAEKPPEE